MNRLLFGPLAGALFAIGVVSLALTIPGYDHVRQTVSEIGATGAPARVPFAILLCAVALCILMFAAGLREVALATGHSPLCAYLTAVMALAAAGVGVFAHPHPLHNVFGLSELVGYQAPLAFALAWRREPQSRRLVVASGVLYVLIMAAIPLNLAALDRGGMAWSIVGPAYGLAQRALFGAWFGWCALTGLSLGWSRLHESHRARSRVRS